jgi:5-methylcytosine-specific restriction enzyme subunit McrC
MNRGFEQFVRTALREALGVTPKRFPDKPPRLSLDQAGRITLEPDLCLLEGSCTIWVGDAKYKRLSGDSHKNSDIYQLLAYTVALDLPTGTLIYASDGPVTPREFVITKAGKKLRLVALDLTVPASAILAQVHALAANISHTSPPRLDAREKSTGSAREN